VIVTELLVLSKSLGIRAAIDIAIIATVFFTLVHTFRVSGTARMAAGLVIAGAIFLLANWLDLRGITWIYSRLSSVLLIAAVVIFQPELRRMLEQGGSLQRGRAAQLPSGLPGLLVEALDTLSQRKWGAIVVLPGRQPINRWLSSGIALNADPSVPLLLSLFDPHSPGHDGAVVISTGRIARFAVRLPLAQSDKLGPEYGTRHHASLGLAEVADALVLTVSEERGSVSVFSAGRMIALKNAESSEPHILEHARKCTSLGPGDGSERAIRRYPFQIGASLAAAVVLWAGVTLPSVQVVERSLDVAIDYVTPADLALVGSKPMNAKLHLAGDEGAIDEVDRGHVKVRIDLSGAQPGRQTVVISAEDVHLPRDVRVLDVEPSSFEVTLNQIVERDVPVVPQLVGQLPAGLKLTGVTVHPASVRAIAPTSPELSTERSLTTSPIYLQGLSASAVLYAKIVAPPSFQPVDRRWPDVEVRIEVAR
jgi:uncharacterized protein (TIGR00159 family)